MSSDPVRRSYEATQLLQNPVWKEAFTAVRADLISALERAAIGDKDTAHSIMLSLQALNQVTRKLERWVAEGKLTEHRNEEAKRG